MLEIIHVKDEELLKRYAKVRYEVFSIEKNVPVEIEVDDYDTLDSICDHYLIRYNDEDIGAIRIKNQDTSIRIQRYCLYKQYRGLGIGKSVLEAIENKYIHKHIYHVEMDAKYDVYPFYEKCGYTRISDMFIEANIPHVKMEKYLLKVESYNDINDDIIDIRTKIFVEEQGFQDEFDDRDHDCTHLLIFHQDRPIATCRYFPGNDGYILGRIAVLKEYRGKRIGEYVVRSALNRIQEGRITLHAQLQAMPFYEKLGFKAYGDIEYEEHCPHTWMEKYL